MTSSLQTFSIDVRLINTNHQALRFKIAERNERSIYRSARFSVTRPPINVNFNWSYSFFRRLSRLFFHAARINCITRCLHALPHVRLPGRKKTFAKENRTKDVLMRKMQIVRRRLMNCKWPRRETKPRELVSQANVPPAVRLIKPFWYLADRPRCSAIWEPDENIALMHICMYACRSDREPRVWAIISKRGRKTRLQKCAFITFL